MSYCFLAGRRCSALAPLPVLPVELAAPGRGSSREVSLRDQVARAFTSFRSSRHPLLNFLPPLFYVYVARRLARFNPSRFNAIEIDDADVVDVVSPKSDEDQ